MFLVFIFNKALKLHIPLQSTMDINNKNKLDAFSFNQDNFIKNLESKYKANVKRIFNDSHQNCGILCARLES